MFTKGNTTLLRTSAPAMSPILLLLLAVSKLPAHTIAIRLQSGCTTVKTQELVLSNTD